MAAGQLLLAFAPGFGIALTARILVGIGDAFTFVSVVRLLPNWFSGRILPQLSQWVGTLGQLGQIIAIVPFALLFHATGWQPSLLVASSLSVVAAAVATVFVRRGEPPAATSPIPTSGLFRQLGATVRRPGTQLGFWAHLVGGTAPTVMALMWGYPFLIAGLGLDISTAGWIFAMLVAGNVVSGPIIGYLVARFPFRRSNLVMAVATIIIVVWSTVLLWPGSPPLWLVGALYFVIGTGGPGSLVGFDVARTTNPSHALGSASGFVNVGGFLGGFVSVFFIGLVIDGVRASGGAEGELYSLDAFRLGFIVPIVVIVIGVIGLLVARRRTRRRMFELEGIQIAPLWVALFRSRRASRPPAAGG
jgi:MFS family permease